MWWRKSMMIRLVVDWSAAILAAFQSGLLMPTLQFHATIFGGICPDSFQTWIFPMKFLGADPYQPV
jgi:hypothetical protein